MVNASSVPHQVVPAGPIGITPSNAGNCQFFCLVELDFLIFPSSKTSHYFASVVVIAVMLKRPRTPPPSNLAMDYQTADSEHVLKRSRPFGLLDEVLCILL